MEITAQRGAVSVVIEGEERKLWFDMAATWLLIQKYGPKFFKELYRVVGDGEFELVSMDALGYFLYVGLQEDAKRKHRTITLQEAQDFLRPWTYAEIFQAVLYAVVGATVTPGKAPATDPAAKPVADAPADPGPTKVSTSKKRSASRSRSSVGSRRGSGR